METTFRPVAILVELAILMAIIYSLFGGVKLALFDLGLDRKYHKFIKMAFIILGGLMMSFFVAHLITFYPRISILLKYRG